MSSLEQSAVLLSLPPTSMTARCFYSYWIQKMNMTLSEQTQRLPFNAVMIFLVSVASNA